MLRRLQRLWSILRGSDDARVREYLDQNITDYLVIPRAVIESMGPAWQRSFVALLEEAHAQVINWPAGQRYWVQRRGARGRFARDLRLRRVNGAQEGLWGVQIQDVNR